MGAGLTLVLAEEAAAKPRRGQLQWQLRLTCSLRLTHGLWSALVCWHWLLLVHSYGFGVLCRRRLQLARCACSTLVLSVLA